MSFVTFHDSFSFTRVTLPSPMLSPGGQFSDRSHMSNSKFAYKIVSKFCENCQILYETVEFDVISTIPELAPYG